MQIPRETIPEWSRNNNLNIALLHAHLREHITLSAQGVKDLVVICHDAINQLMQEHRPD
jgi:hypothetical protein